MSRKGIMIILDGYGEGEKYEFNAVENANTPYLKFLKENKPNCYVGTDSRHVGLPENTMGGSEVGHMTIGAGKIKRSMQVKVDEEIKNGQFFNRKILLEKFKKLKENNGSLHIAGLWSDKKTHSNIHHCFALMEMAKRVGIEKVFIHTFTDGRDTSTKVSKEYFEMFNNKSKQLGLGEIATIGGRFYAMDRENNLERTEKALNKFTQKEYDFEDYASCIDDNYSKGLTDEFIVPARIKTEKEYSLTKNDLLIFYNTRGDRMKQPVKMVSEKFDCDVLTFCEFVDGVDYLFEEDNISNTLVEYLSNLGLKQLKVSESTKYAHVTYFFNGGREEPFDGEERIHVVTEKTDDYAHTPKMHAPEITNETIKALNSNKFDAIYVNYSNPDMIGHTGDYEACVKALECLDDCVKKVVKTAQDNDYFVLLCADHGNAEKMKDSLGKKYTSHTLSPVKCVIIDKENENMIMHNGGLQDVAPTFLKLMNIKQNPSFEGKPLF